MKEMDITPEGWDLVREWMLAEAAITQAEKDLARAKERAVTARDGLGKHFTPDNASMGEEFTQWVGDGMIRFAATQAAEGKGLTGYRVLWRKAPSEETKIKNNLP
jgi:hypothetical protein